MTNIESKVTVREAALTFTSYAWLKLLFLLHHIHDTECGCYGVTSLDDPLTVLDLYIPTQEVTTAFVSFTEDLAETTDNFLDRNVQPRQWQRIWIHTHPGNSASPSSKDVETFDQLMSGCDYSIMFILARDESWSCRLRTRLGPYSITRELPLFVDWNIAECPPLDIPSLITTLKERCLPPTPPAPPSFTTTDGRVIGRHYRAIEASYTRSIVCPRCRSKNFNLYHCDGCHKNVGTCCYSFRDNLCDTCAKAPIYRTCEHCRTTNCGPLTRCSDCHAAVCRLCCIEDKAGPLCLECVEERTEPFDRTKARKKSNSPTGEHLAALDDPDIALFQSLAADENNYDRWI